RSVVAVEADETVADGLYRSLREASDTRILPLVVDLADPSPGLGWAGAERAPFGARAHADVVLALALVHHLAIGRNVPLPRLLDWLGGARRPPGGGVRRAARPAGGRVRRPDRPDGRPAAREQARRPVRRLPPGRVRAVAGGPV